MDASHEKLQSSQPTLSQQSDGMCEALESVHLKEIMYMRAGLRCNAPNPYSIQKTKNGLKEYNTYCPHLIIRNETPMNLYL